MATTIGSLDLNAFSDLHSDLTQYFWFEGNASATYGAGVHVTLVPDTTFISNPTGQNILMNTDGFSIRNGLLPMMILDNDSLDFNAVDTSLGTYTTMATFGLTGATIGQTGGAHSIIDANGQRFYASDGTTQLANIGYGIGQGSSGSTSSDDYPYYTFGTRRTDTATTRGNFSLAEGVSVEASGYASHAEGYYTTASGAYSHAEGNHTTASSLYSHAEGNYTTASSTSCHAEGYSTTASAPESHAEGFNCEATNNYAHAEGDNTTASGRASHAAGFHTVAGYAYQTVVGQYNNNKSTSLFEIGKGTSDSAKANAFAVTETGVLEIGDSANTFVKTKETILSSKAMASGNVQSDTKTISKSGYYPICIAGWDTDSGDINPSRIRLSSRGDGSATISYLLKNVGSTSRTVTVTVDLVWVKIA